MQRGLAVWMWARAVRPGWFRGTGFAGLVLRRQAGVVGALGLGVAEDFAQGVRVAGGVVPLGLCVAGEPSPRTRRTTTSDKNQLVGQAERGHVPPVTLPRSKSQPFFGTFEKQATCDQRESALMVGHPLRTLPALSGYATAAIERLSRGGPCRLGWRLGRTLTRQARSRKVNPLRPTW